jgi:hypothetical protein
MILCAALHIPQWLKGVLVVVKNAGGAENYRGYI